MSQRSSSMKMILLICSCKGRSRTCPSLVSRCEHEDVITDLSPPDEVVVLVQQAFRSVE
jgi:hypothetical protein